MGADRRAAHQRRTFNKAKRQKNENKYRTR
jgi:hypothetical protein